MTLPGIRKIVFTKETVVLIHLATEAVKLRVSSKRS